MFFIILDIHAFTVGGVMTTLFIKPRWQYSEIKRFKNCVRSFFFSKHETPPIRKEKPRQVCYLSRVLYAVIRSANATEVARVLNFFHAITTHFDFFIINRVIDLSRTMQAE